MAADEIRAPGRGTAAGPRSRRARSRPVLLAHFLGASAPAEFLLRVSAAELKERTLGVLLCDAACGAASDTPVVLVVENVHWIDASSEEFSPTGAEPPATGSS